MTPIEPFRSDQPQPPGSPPRAAPTDAFFSQTTFGPGPPPRDANEVFFETLFELTPTVYMTWGLLAINVLVYLVMTASAIDWVKHDFKPVMQPSTATLLAWGADYGPRTLAGEWWRMLSCAFVHIGLIHILMNMACLISVGPLVERMVGNAGFLVLYLVCALGGSVASLWWSPLIVSAGASGAVFGLYGALLTLQFRQHGSIPADAIANARNGGLMFLAYNLFYGFTQPNIDNAGHIGGLVTGLVGGLVLSQPLTLESLAGRLPRNVALGVLGALLVGGATWFVWGMYADLGPADEAREGFGKVEAKALADFQSLAQRLDRGEISGESCAEAVERDVLLPWNELLAEFARFKRLPERRKAFVAAVIEYMQARKEVWELFAQGARENNAQKFAQAEAKVAAVNQAVAAIKAIVEKGG